jgi:hypothetical protein
MTKREIKDVTKDKRDDKKNRVRKEQPDTLILTRRIRCFRNQTTKRTRTKN